MNINQTEPPVTEQRSTLRLALAVLLTQFPKFARLEVVEVHLLTAMPLQVTKQKAAEFDMSREELRRAITRLWRHGYTVLQYNPDKKRGDPDTYKLTPQGEEIFQKVTS